jgi:hypothetical protein
VEATRERYFSSVYGPVVREWIAAIVNDTATLERLLAPDFDGTSPASHTFTKTLDVRSRLVMRAMLNRAVVRGSQALVLQQRW